MNRNLWAFARPEIAHILILWTTKTNWTRGPLTHRNLSANGKWFNCGNFRNQIKFNRQLLAACSFFLGDELEKLKDGWSTHWGYSYIFPRLQLAELISDALIYCWERSVPLNLNADYDYLDNVLYIRVIIYIECMCVRARHRPRSGPGSGWPTAIYSRCLQSRKSCAWDCTKRKISSSISLEVLQLPCCVSKRFQDQLRPPNACPNPARRSTI